MKNTLYFGDNLDILRNSIADESIDLIYLDPPFNSKRDYNLLFKTPKGMESDAQITAFEDSWHWGEQAENEFREIQKQPNTDVAEMMQALRSFLGENDMMAYLTMMANRLLVLHRVLKDTGSLYLHCDPTASHYLKIVLDGVFGKLNFKSEIIWRRTGSHNKANRWAPIHDVLFYYVKSDNYCWKNPKRPYMMGHVRDNFVEDGNGGYRTNYYGNVLTGSGTRNGESGKVWKGFDPTAKGRHWAIPGSIWDEVEFDPSGLSQHEKLDMLFEKGFIKITEGAAWPIYEKKINKNDGPATSDLWTYQPYTEGAVFGTKEGVDADVSWIKPRDAERLGYPTQKPLALLERIIAASSNEGDVVLDPFCGCGTAVDAAQNLKRKWIGIDITHLSINLIEERMKKRYPELKEKGAFETLGVPKDFAAASNLALRDKYQFQYWALSLVKAQPFKGGKKGADGGVDGFIFPEVAPGKTEKIIVSVKGGENVGLTMLKDLITTVAHNKAAIGLFVTLTPPTKPMIAEAAAAGHFESPHHGAFARIQILTIEGLLNSTERAKFPDMSYGQQTFKAAKVADKTKKSGDLFNV